MTKPKTRVRRWTLPAFALVLALVFSLLSPVSALAASQEPQMTMVVLGDSIASGYGVPAGLGYAPIVARSQNMALVNCAVGGWRTEHVVNQLRTDEATREAVKAADVIQITIGGNDLQQAGHVGPAIDAIMQGDKSVWEQHSENIAARFSQIVALVRDLNPTAPFFVFNSYSPDYKRFGAINISSTIGATVDVTGNELYAIAQDYAIPRFNQTYERYLQKNPGAFILVDVFSAFPGNASSYYGLGIDVIHPSASGHAKLADRLNTAIDVYNNKHVQTEPTAKVEKLCGNKNLLTIEIKETYPLKPATTITVSLIVNNNAAGHYKIGKHTVYVDTKGNNKCKACHMMK